MKFCTSAVTTATAIIAFFGAPVSSKKRFSKSGGGASLPLEPYRYFEPADFEGSYKTCFATVIRNSASSFFGGGGGTYHLCEGDQIYLIMSLQKFTKTDDYGGYQSTSEGVPEEGIDLGSFQGIANGNTLPMASFGPGVYTPAGPWNPEPDLVPNNTPDMRTCTMFADNVMECASFFTAYCNGVLEGGGSPSCVDGQQWRNTYAVEEILVLDGEECPEAPAGFCGSNEIGGPPNTNRRGLQDESGSAKKTPCPFLAGKMDE
mmetsp:Transcript_19783/g.33725  ORF Transcript_19783/g.33725 Transcript_19783/m.33725 type:complete len:261 (-) Transcript_19783:162-944(-)